MLHFMSLMEFIEIDHVHWLDLGKMHLEVKCNVSLSIYIYKSFNSLCKSVLTPPQNTIILHHLIHSFDYML